MEGQNTNNDWSDREFRAVAADLIEAVEKYVRQECSRSTLIWRKEHLKRLIDQWTN